MKATSFWGREVEGAAADKREDTSLFQTCKECRETRKGTDLENYETPDRQHRLIFRGSNVFTVIILFVTTNLQGRPIKLARIWWGQHGYVMQKGQEWEKHEHNDRLVRSGIAVMSVVQGLWNHTQTLRRRRYLMTCTEQTVIFVT